MDTQDSGFSRLMLVFAIALSVVGAAVSAVLLQHHVAARLGSDPLLNSVCEAAEVFSCSDVIASEWGRIEWGEGEHKTIIPTAGLGYAFFACLAAWFIVVGRPAGSRRWLHLLPVAALVLGFAGCVFFAYIMFFRLEKTCPLCSATHLITLLLLVVTLLMWPRRATQGTAVVAQPPLRAVLGAVLLAAATIGVGWSEYHSRIDKAYAAEYFTRWQDYEKDTQRTYEAFTAQKTVNIPVTPGVDPILGPVDAPHTIIVYSDFQCPFCRGLSLHLKELLDKYPGQARIVFKHFPMNKTCNSHVTRSLHAGSCSAAVVAEAAFLLEGNDAFWTFHDQLFAKQSELQTGRSLEEFAYKTAEQLGISREDFLKRIQTYSVWDRIKANIEEAHSFGISQTPVMYVDGRRMSAWGDKHFWRYVLSEDARKEAGLTATSAPASAPASQPVTSQPVTQAADSIEAASGE